MWSAADRVALDKAMINDFDLEDELEYPEELHPVLELSDSILEYPEKLDTIRGKLDDFEQRYLEADEELSSGEGYEIPSSTKLKRWQAEIEEISDCIDLLSNPL